MSGRFFSRVVCLSVTITLILTSSVITFAEDEMEGGISRASSLEEYIDATAPADTPADGEDELFGTCRIKIKKMIRSQEGAVEGVSYRGDTLLCFGSAAETRKAYKRLSKEYGAENVIVDIPVLTADSVAKPVGWGTAFMNIGEEIKRQAKEHGDDAGKVTIAVIDSGIDRTHEIFEGRTISPLSKDFIGSENDIADEDGHGTSVAGIISESTPDNVELMILKTYTDGNSISLETVGQAVRYAADNGADVINLSMSTAYRTSMEQYPELVKYSIGDMDEQLRYAAEKGVIICASSGNRGGDMAELNSYPAISDYTIAVGALDNSGSRWEYSNYGSKLDFCAPGHELIVAAYNSDSSYYALDLEHCSGTSFASPYIAACCAFVKMDDSSAGNSKAIAELSAKCVDYGDEGWDRYYGWGMPKYEEFVEEPDPQPVVDPSKDKAEAKAQKIKTITVNAATVSPKVIDKVVKRKGGSAKYVTKIILGSKVKKINPKAFAKYKKVTTIEVRTKKLKKKSIKNSLRNSKVKTVRVKVSKKAKTNRSYVKKYKRIFTKKNAGRKAAVK